MAALATVNVTKARPTHPTARSAINRLHQSLDTPIGCEMSATRRAAGTAAKKSQDTGTAANPKRRTTLGASRTAARAVAKIPLGTNLRIDGLCAGGPCHCRGQARATETAISAPRTTSMATTSAMRAGQESW